MGDPATPPRTTLSPTKLGSRSLAFGQSPSSPKESFSRSNVFQNRNPLSPQPSGFNHQNLNSSVSGPPTQGLFDSLASTAPVSNPHESFHRQVTSPFSPVNTVPAPAVNESMYTPRRTSIIPGPKHNFTASPFPGPSSASVVSNSNATLLQTTPSGAECWVTVFGFPQSATSMILSHFSQCGTIVNKMQPKNNIGNWLHLRFTNRLECDRALNFNEKVLNNFFMIGVVRCRDPAVLELEQLRADDLENSSFIGNTNPNSTPVTQMNTSSIRPLAHIAYKTTVQNTDVVASPTAPTKSSGILDRAMDFFLGW